MKNTYKIFTLIASVLFVFSCSDLEEDRSGILSLDNLKSDGDLVAALTPGLQATSSYLPRFSNPDQYLWIR
jgi:hypothetical protein